MQISSAALVVSQQGAAKAPIKSGGFEPLPLKQTAPEKVQPAVAGGAVRPGSALDIKV